MPITETEWVALISVSGTIISGGLGSFVTFRITKRSIDSSVVEGSAQRTHDSNERALDRQHERELAVQSRSQSRRQDAYVAIQTVIHAIDQYAARHLVGIGRPDEDETTFPEIPAETEALSQLVASGAVVEGMNTVNNEMILLQAAIADARFWRGEAVLHKPGALDDFHRVNGDVRAAATKTTSAVEAVHT